MSQLSFGSHRNLPTIEIWSDGSGTTAGEPGGWGTILRYQKNGEWIEKEMSGGLESATNNQAELTAVLEGLRAVKRPCRIKIYSDSQYVCGAWSKGWFLTWIRKDYKGVKNDDLWRAIWEATDGHEIEAIWIRGHNGTELNERCDKLAGQERRKLLDSVMVS